MMWRRIKNLWFLSGLSLEGAKSNLNKKTPVAIIDNGELFLHHNTKIKAKPAIIVDMQEAPDDFQVPAV